jgi:hypothetical protein
VSAGDRAQRLGGKGGGAREDDAQRARPVTPPCVGVS